KESSTNKKPGARPGSSEQIYPLLLGVDAHEGMTFRALLRELDLAVLEREQRVVGAQAHVRARAHGGAALADQDVAGENAFAAELLHAEALAVRFAAVTGTAACLFVCHVSKAPLTSYQRSGADRGDLDLRVLLAVRALAQVVLAAAEFHDDLLVTLAVLLDDGLDLAALEQRRADLDVVAIGEQQHVAERHGRTRFC